MNQAHEYGEPVYAYQLRLTEVKDFGVSMTDVLEGKQSPPLCGLRVNIDFEGEASGKLAGRIEGTDYLNIRPDGRMELDIRATLTTPDGARIAMRIDGVGLPQERSTASVLRENIQLTTADPRYAWVNTLQLWGVGEADVSTGKVSVRGFIPR